MEKELKSKIARALAKQNFRKTPSVLAAYLDASLLLDQDGSDYFPQRNDRCLLNH